MIPCRILGTAHLLPGEAVLTTTLAREVRPDQDPESFVTRTGITTRHWAPREAPLAELAAQVVSAALEQAGLRPEALDRIILANCTGAEFAFPAVSNALCAALGLRGSCACVTINNACMGFVTALDMAARFVATGTGPVAVVSAELCSRHISAAAPRPYLVFGDGIGAAIVGPAPAGEGGVLASWLANDGSLGGNAVLRNTFVGEAAEPIQFLKSSKEMTEIAVGALVKATHETLARAGLCLDDIQWVLPHQPNGSMFETIIEALGVARARTLNIVGEVGSVGSASIAISLDRLARSGRVQAGDRILMVGVGSGVAYGALVFGVEEPWFH